MLKLSVTKIEFEDILSLKKSVIQKPANQYWSNKLLEPKLIDNHIYYEVKKPHKIAISNGLGEDKPLIVIECQEIIHMYASTQFHIVLGKVLEHKNTDIATHKDMLIEQLLKEKKQLEDKVHTDHLTGVYNRRKMESDLEAASFTQIANYLAVAFVDADHFKNINDNYGHDTGDRALKYLAQKLKKYEPTINAKAYRYGGEEFVLVCVCEKSKLLHHLEELRHDIKSESIYHPDGEISFTVSIGVSFWEECKNIQTLIKKADENVYKAKEKGRDTIVI